MAKLTLSSAATTQILVLLRFIQHGALVLTGFVTSYFIYWHNALRDPVPLPLILLLIAVIISYLENYISSALSLHLHHQPRNHPLHLLLKTSLPPTLLLTLPYYLTRQIPFVREWCEGDNWFRPVRETDGYTLKPAGVEEHQCALVCVLVGAGLVAVGVSVVIAGIGGVGMVLERQRGMGMWIGRTRRGGYAMVGEGETEMGDEYEYDGSTVCSVEDDK